MSGKCDCGRSLPFKGVNEHGRTYQQQRTWERVMLHIATATVEELEVLQRGLNEIAAERAS